MCEKAKFSTHKKRNLKHQTIYSNKEMIPKRIE